MWITALAYIRDWLQARRPNNRRVLDKRRLEELLRQEGMSRSTARRVVSEYFK